ncbi:MAG: MFS transporter [bacterium]
MADCIDNEKSSAMASGNRKAIVAWCMYDWANSAFATTVMAGFFPIFFKKFWCEGTDFTVSTARLGLANSFASIFVALAAPILGAIADKGSSKKKFLFFFAYMGVIMTSSLYLVSQGRWAVAVFLYVLANIGFAGGNIFYDSLITAVAPEKKMDIVSSLGFSLGYLGGGLLFALNVWMTLRPQSFGFAAASEAVQFSFLSVGLWWSLFSIPIFMIVKEPRGVNNLSVFTIVRAGFLQLKETFQEIRHLKSIFLFLLAYWFYIDGVDTIIRMAIDYGISIGLDSNNLIIALLITQFVGFPAAIIYGYMGEKIGTKRAIYIAIGVYLGVSFWGAFIQGPREFYILAIIVGLVQGGIQALSRSFYARIIPVNKSAEYFGFYNMLGKFASVLGPVLIGGVGLLVKSMGFSSSIASRTGISSISILFITGGLLFSRVNEEKAKEEIKYL